MSERPDTAHDGKAEHGRGGHRGHYAAEHRSGGDGSHHDHTVADFRRPFWVSLILSIPVLALAPSIQALLGFSVRLAFPGDRSVQAVFATVSRRIERTKAASPPPLTVSKRAVSSSAPLTPTIAAPSRCP